MPEMRPRPKPDKGKIKVLECPNEHGLIGDLLGMTIEDFQAGSWRKKLAARDLDPADMEFLTGILDAIKVRGVNKDDEPPADLIWIKENKKGFKVWKFGINVTPKE